MLDERAQALGQGGGEGHQALPPTMTSGCLSTTRKAWHPPDEGTDWPILPHMPGALV
ncbi:hypothetical protein D3C78_1998450 [compost metagenome]